MGILDNLKSRNFSVYAQIAGYITIILSLALGIANLFNAGIIILFGVLSIVFGFVLIFVELPFLLRICPTSEKFDGFIRRFGQNWATAVLYLVIAVVDFLSSIVKSTSLIIPGVFALITAGLYGIAGLKKQDFHPDTPFGKLGTVESARLARTMVA